MRYRVKKEMDTNSINRNRLSMLQVDDIVETAGHFQGFEIMRVVKGDKGMGFIMFDSEDKEEHLECL